ncbi:zinc finger C4H2 domain-containing protein isoform X1 [Strongylocentrotus purpuratus]|uniref:C4H2-type domain-containing protein n=1 Tax=Strongylocentrotus purpuratus TaxID=7668 RepID=A0A7M7HK52_STRPU|nr:zinc finger C4H2 domain-containing protein isoform X1 [Strongylocentrotus purpuratus]
MGSDVNSSEVLLGKMTYLKDIRSQTVHLEKMKGRLLVDMQEAEKEEDRLKEYRHEMELLNQERLAHVEELRQIHSDINTIESVIKNTEGDRNKAFEAAWKMYQEYVCLKEQINAQRMSIGLDRIPELTEEDRRLDPDLLRKRRAEWHDIEKRDPPSPLIPTCTLPLPLEPPPPFQMPGTSHSKEMNGPPPPPPFKQQPPPMKNCLSCHQQIHRNAPICPLCKAKSRSRNPKKTKRKHEQ